MGFTDLLSDLYASISFMDVHAEAPPEEAGGADEEAGEDEAKDDGGEKDEQEENGEKQEAEDGEKEEESEESEESEDEPEEQEEEEEEEEEVEDIKPKLEKECAKSAQCAPLKHHYHECAERVRIQEENPDHKGPKEDCVEEFFHLSHCATQCAAPKLFSSLK